MWLTVTDSSSPSASCTPVTVTVCAVDQFDGVKVSLSLAAAVLTVTAPVSPLDGVMTTLAVGSLSSFTV